MGDLEAVSFPLHDVVVADDACMPKQQMRSRFLVWVARRFHGAGLSGETAVVVGDELVQDGVGGVQVGGLGQPEFADEAILQHAPKAFDTAFGLGGVGGDVGDAELFQGTAELGGLAFSGELFFHGPAVVVADEDAAAIAVEGQRTPKRRSSWRSRRK